MHLLVLVGLTILCFTEAISAGNFTDEYEKFLDRFINVLDDLIDRTGQPSQEDEDRIACSYGLNALLRNLGTSWGLSIMDSGSKIQSGFLTGNLLELGQYDECVGVSVEPTSEQPYLPKFTGQHCLITTSIYIPGGTIVINGVRQKLIDLFGDAYIPLTLAQCFPSTCKPWVIQEGLNAALWLPDEATHLLGANFNINVTIKPTDCHVAEQPPIDVLDWVVLTSIIILASFGIISSAVDYFYLSIQGIPSTGTKKLIGSFSFYSNTRKLFSLTMAPDSIASLNGLKFFSMCWVVLGHRFIYLTREPLNNYTEIPNDMKEILMMIILNATLSVDTFFLISGMLNMYGFCYMMNKTKRYTVKDLINGYVHRYLRLTPAYLMMIGFTATWQYRLRDGPLWDRFVGDYKDGCRDSYWKNLIYLNNYLKPVDECMMQSWYLSADMQFFWLSPFLAYPLWRWPRLGTIQLILFIIASIVSPFMVSWFHNIQAPIPITTNTARRVHEMELLYYPAYTKSISYVLGIGAGYLLYKYRQGKLNISLSTLTRSIGWILATVFMLYAVFGGYYLFQLDSGYHQLFSAFFIGFQRFFWSLGMIWVIWMCATNNGGFVNTILSWKVFIPLGRLSYCMYLTHIVVLMCSIATMRAPIHYNFYEQFEMYLGDLVLCLMAALALTLLVEAPMLNLEKLIFSRAMNKTSRPQSQPRLNEAEREHEA